MIRNISIIGDGGWGTTLGIYLSKKNYKVTLWSPFPAYAQVLKKTRHNKKFLPGVKIPDTMIITDNLDLAIEQSDLVVLAIPSQYLKNVLKKIRSCRYSSKPFLSVIKGIDSDPLERVSEMIHHALGPVCLAVLSGPTIAREVAQGIPSSAVVASSNQKFAKKIQKIFHSSDFRIYTNSDMIGVEIGGSVKNIIAIACGVCDGLGFGTNTKAAIVTRGLAEMARLGKALGAKASTFFGLSGLGDLTTTCFSPQSRNRCVGFELAQGKTLKQITSSMFMVAEGVSTVKAVYRMSQKHHVPMPITAEVFQILYKKKNPRKAVKDLMARQLKSE